MNTWLADLQASDYSPATLRSYAYDMLSWMRFLAAVEPVLVPVPAPAFVWIARYLAQREPGPPTEPVWMTVKGPPRPLTYWALRQVLERVNAVIGTNVTMHDFRHTFCTRLAEDENMTMTDLQELMRHASVTSTQVYLRPRLDDLVAKLDEHWSRPPAAPPAAAAGYDPGDLQTLFGKGF